MHAMKAIVVESNSLRSQVLTSMLKECGIETVCFNDSNAFRTDWDIVFKDNLSRYSHPYLMVLSCNQYNLDGHFGVWEYTKMRNPGVRAICLIEHDARSLKTLDWLIPRYYPTFNQKRGKEYILHSNPILTNRLLVWPKSASHILQLKPVFNSIKDVFQQLTVTKKLDTFNNGKGPNLLAFEQKASKSINIINRVLESKWDSSVPFRYQDYDYEEEE